MIVTAPRGVDPTAEEKRISPPPAVRAKVCVPFKVPEKVIVPPLEPRDIPEPSVTGPVNEMAPPPVVTFAERETAPAPLWLNAPLPVIKLFEPKGKVTEPVLAMVIPPPADALMAPLNVNPAPFKLIPPAAAVKGPKELAPEGPGEF